MLEDIKFEEMTITINVVQELMEVIEFIKDHQPPPVIEVEDFGVLTAAPVMQLIPLGLSIFWTPAHDDQEVPPPAYTGACLHYLVNTGCPSPGTTLRSLRTSRRSTRSWTADTRVTATMTTSSRFLRLSKSSLVNFWIILDYVEEYPDQFVDGEAIVRFVLH